MKRKREVDIVSSHKGKRWGSVYEELVGLEAEDRDSGPYHLPIAQDQHNDVRNTIRSSVARSGVI